MNSLNSIVPNLFASTLQETLHDATVALMAGLAEPRFQADLSVGDEIDWSRHNKRTVQVLADPNADVTVQPIITTGEKLIININVHDAFDINQKEMVQVIVDPINNVMRESQIAYAERVDTDLLSEYANAGIVFDDGDLIGGTATNPVVLSAANVNQVFIQLRKKMKQNSMRMLDSRIIIDPAVLAAIMLDKSNFVGANVLGDSMVMSGQVGLYQGFRIWESNRLIVTGATTHILAYSMDRGSPVSFATQIFPTLEHTTSNMRTKFVGLWKSQLLYGIKTFVSGREMLVDVQLDLSGI